MAINRNTQETSLHSLSSSKATIRAKPVNTENKNYNSNPNTTKQTPTTNRIYFVNSTDTMIHPKFGDSGSSRAIKAERPVSSNGGALRSAPPATSKTKRRTSKSAPEAPTKDMTPLGPNFQLGKLDVICSRGKFAYNSPGNCWFRCMVEEKMDAYGNARTKTDKSLVVSVLVNRVKQANPRGGFVKNVAGQWYRVSERYSREKVGQQFRDLLHNKYKSSTKAKAEKRKRQHDGDLEHSVSSLDDSLSNRSQSDRNRHLSQSPAQSPAASSPRKGSNTQTGLAPTAPKMPSGLEASSLDMKSGFPSRRHPSLRIDDIMEHQLPGLKLENDINEDECDIDLGFGDLEPLDVDSSTNKDGGFALGGLDDNFSNIFANNTTDDILVASVAPPIISSFELPQVTKSNSNMTKRRKNNNNNNNNNNTMHTSPV